MAKAKVEKLQETKVSAQEFSLEANKSTSGGPNILNNKLRI
jgi:hypothetical protein